jgi:hypothetical protein
MQTDTFPSTVSGFIGILLEPRITLSRLFDAPHPPYALGYLSLLGVTIAVPSIAYALMWGFSLAIIQMLIALLGFYLLTILCFIVLLTALLILVRYETSLRQVLGVVGYASVPLTIALCLVYGVHWYSAGSILPHTLIRGVYEAQGAPASNSLVRFLPYAAILCQLMISWVYLHALKESTKTHILTAIILSVVSLFPLSVSLVCGLVFAEVVKPGIIDFISSFITPAA